MSARLPCLVCLILMLATGAARAEAQAGARPTMLVMESSAGLSGATRLRAILSKRLGVPVIGASEVSAEGPRPALLAVAVDRTRGVTVVYVSEHSETDTLSAPMPGDASMLEGVVTALATALLQRHLPELTAPAEPVRPSTGQPAPGLYGYSELDVVKASRILHAALVGVGTLRRRSGILRADDF